MYPILRDASKLPEIKLWVITREWNNIRYFGDTKKCFERGIGNEIILGSLGYKNVHLNLSFKYFNGLKSDNVNNFEGYQFPNTAV